jgi:hypothetical protein
MPDTTITLPLDEMRTLMNKAILDTLSAEAREKLIQHALDYLMTGPKVDRGFGKGGESPLELAFNNAVRELAGEVAKDIVTEQKPKITEAIRAMLEKLDGGISGVNGWQLQHHLAGGIIAYIEEAERQRRNY